MIKLSFGSIFDKKCDLLIIPCNTGGGVTHWVSSNLRENSIPLPDKYIPFGKVYFTSTQLHFENAAFVGYAASVEIETNTSNKNGIESAANEILNYSATQKIRQVNLPLLGTGAGKLSPYEVIEIYGKTFNKAEGNDILFEIFTPSRELFDSLATSYPGLIKISSENKCKNPRVFISYAGDDKENSKWVRNLTNNLRENGVDARLDRFHLKPGMDLPQWMTNEVIMADKVILVCDYNYMNKADIRKGGVGWETMIIQGDMLSLGDTKSKYIAIVREEEIDKGLPIYMKSKLAFHWKKTDHIDPDDFKSLLFSIFDCDIAPELGDIPDYIIKKLHSHDI